MASFTDQIMQSNPYVQQLPLEAMAQVGMYKQQRYEEGVQKIQGQIDKIAGMDVLRDVDKQYLQSKLNELGSRLKNVAAGDFSNFQLVNSVGGMANQIGQDKTVQNSVSSTAWYRKQQADIEAARKEGKSSASNIYDFNQQANGWLNGTAPGEVFRGTYTPYRDVNKKVLEVIGKLHPKATTEDIAYGTNPDGTINTGKILDSMRRKGIETVDEGQIRTAVNSVLDADDINQLAIDGRYNLRGVSQVDLAKSAINDYERSKQSYQAELNKQKRNLLMSTDIDQQQIINRNIKYYQDMLGDPQKGIKGILDENYERLVTNIEKNPDVAKASLYTKNYLDQIANGFAWANVKDEILSNPVKENFWKKKNYELDLLKEKHLETDRAFGRYIESAKLELENKKYDAEHGPGMPYWKRSGDQTTDNLTSLQNYTEYNNKLDNDNQGILGDLAAKNSSIDVTISPNEIKAKIEKYKNNKYTPATQYEKDQMDKYIDNENALANQKAIYERYEKQANEELGTQGILDNALKGRGNLKIGNQIFTPREVYDYLKKEKSKADVTNLGPDGSVRTVTLYTEDKDLTSKERILKQAFANRYVGVSNAGTPTTGNATLDAYIKNFDPTLAQNKQLQKKVIEKVAEKLAPITGSFATEQSPISFKNENNKLQFITTLTNIAKADLDQKTGGPQYQPNKAIELLTKKASDDVDFQFRRKGGEYYVQVTDKANPKDVQLIKVDEDFVMQNPSLGKNYVSDNLDLGENLLRNGGTTNIFKDQAHAKYQTGKFGGYDARGQRTVTLPVAADLVNQGGQIYPVFYLQTSNGPIRFEYPQPTSPSDFKTKYLPSLTDDKILSLFKIKYPNIEQLIQE